jgi:hypothetical protein
MSAIVCESAYIADSLRSPAARSLSVNLSSPPLTLARITARLQLRAELNRRTLPLRSRDFSFNWKTAWVGVWSVTRVVAHGPLCSSLYG